MSFKPSANPTENNLGGKMGKPADEGCRIDPLPERSSPSACDPNETVSAMPEKPVSADNSQETSKSTMSQPESDVSKEASLVSPAEYEKQIADLKQEVEDFRQRAMRWQAELENYQKRVARQLADEKRYAAIELIRDLLPVYDNLQRALQSAEQNHDLNQVLQGIRMILKQWEDVLGKHHCQKIDALHKPFDPNLHHAISRQATGDVPPNTVLYVAQDGFILHDRVVRPSQVVVSMALPTSGGEGVSEAVDTRGKESPSDNHPPSN